jgi:hypothetical protein
MPVLSNARHERFAQALAQGKSATEALEVAGFKPNRRNTTRLKTKEDVAARVAELQERGAAKTEITLAGLTERLVRIADTAEALQEPAGLAVSRAALMDAAKLNGLVVERKEVRSGSLDELPADEQQRLGEALREELARRLGGAREGATAH